jgi:L-serine/L-threonine ammonia-lyase
VGTLALSILRKHGPTAQLVTSSGGNAGLACAHAAKAYGMACTVYVPTSVKKIVVGRLEGMGARVVVGGADWYEADKALRMYVSEDPESRYVGSQSTLRKGD